MYQAMELHPLLKMPLVLQSGLSLERRPEDQIPPVPADLKDWMAQRAEERGIPISDIL